MYFHPGATGIFENFGILITVGLNLRTRESYKIRGPLQNKRRFIFVY